MADLTPQSKLGGFKITSEPPFSKRMSIGGLAQLLWAVRHAVGKRTNTVKCCGCDSRLGSYGRPGLQFPTDCDQATTKLRPPLVYNTIRNSICPPSTATTWSQLRAVEARPRRVPKLECQPLLSHAGTLPMTFQYVGGLKQRE